MVLLKTDTEKNKRKRVELDIPDRSLYHTLSCTPANLKFAGIGNGTAPKDGKLHRYAFRDGKLVDLAEYKEKPRE